MRGTVLLPVGSALAGLMAIATSALAAGDLKAGARAFRACVACHSLKPGRHGTGPSLDNIWRRKAGTVEGFTRYSTALRATDLVWDEKTLDAWLANPKALVPGNHMTFPGIRNTKVRADLIAFLKTASGGGSAHRSAQRAAGMPAPELPDLKTMGLNHQVTAIRYCGDTYHVTTATGELPPYWEFNLRFKTASGDGGPAKGRPVIMRAGMRGDRASVIFADPSEFGAFIRKNC